MKQNVLFKASIKSVLKPRATIPFSLPLCEPVAIFWNAAELLQSVHESFVHRTQSEFSFLLCINTSENFHVTAFLCCHCWQQGLNERLFQWYLSVLALWFFCCKKKFTWSLVGIILRNHTQESYSVIVCYHRLTTKNHCRGVVVRIYHHCPTATFSTPILFTQCYLDSILFAYVCAYITNSTVSYSRHLISHYSKWHCWSLPWEATRSRISPKNCQHQTMLFSFGVVGMANSVSLAGWVRKKSRLLTDKTMAEKIQIYIHIHVYRNEGRQSLAFIAPEMIPVFERGQECL